MRVNAAVAKFLAAGARDGSIGDAAQPDDITVILAGSVSAAAASTDREQIARVLNLVMAGLRPTANRSMIPDKR